MKHALVVGGSGMLAKTSLWLAENGYKVSVIGRNQQNLRKLIDINPDIIPISVDYNHERQFRSCINNSVASQGPYESVVAWIHNNDKKIIQIIESEIRRTSSMEWSLYHVLGSSSNLEDIRKELASIENCKYHQIQLGFIIENSQSRWLTNDEISDGVIYGIRSKLKKHLVGTLMPWNQRP
jgi:hypothetical protein